MRDYIVINRLLYDGIKNLPDEYYRDAVSSVLEYAFEGKEPKKRNIAGSFAVAIFKDMIDEDTRKYENFKGRGTAEYREWKNAVLERDDYTCQICGSKGSVHAHHIKSYTKYPDLRYEVGNGVTLCVECHRKMHHRRKDEEE